MLESRLPLHTSISFEPDTFDIHKLFTTDQAVTVDASSLDSGMRRNGGDVGNCLLILQPATIELEIQVKNTPLV
jgi:hypothetical protein